MFGALKSITISVAQHRQAILNKFYSLNLYQYEL